MSYGLTSSTSIQKTRFDSLAPLWSTLKRLNCAEWMKIRAIKQAFWPRAFYGVAVCNIGWDLIKALRTKAMQALRHDRAGASPALRLYFLCHEQADPGFYQLQLVLRTFQRVAKNRPALLKLWAEFMGSDGGGRSYGPFGKLLGICAQVQWKVEPPMIHNADGLCFSLVDIEEGSLEFLLRDAWAQKIAWDLG